MGEPFEYRVAVGSLADVAALKQRHGRGRRCDDGAAARVSRLLHCVLPPRHGSNDGCVDTTWAMAADSGPPDESGRSIEIDSGHAVSGEHPVALDGRARRAAPAVLVRLPAHRRASRTALMGLGREIGYGAEMEWIEEILQLAGLLVGPARHRRSEDADPEGVDAHRRHGARVRRPPARAPHAGRGCDRTRLSVPIARATGHDPLDVVPARPRSADRAPYRAAGLVCL